MLLRFKASGLGFRCYLNSGFRLFVSRFVGSDLWFRYHGFRFRDEGSQVEGSGFRVKNSASVIWVAAFRVEGWGLRVQGSGFRVQGPGFGVWGLGFESSGLRSSLQKRDQRFRIWNLTANTGCSKWHNA